MNGSDRLVRRTAAWPGNARRGDWRIGSCAVARMNPHRFPGFLARRRRSAPRPATHPCPQSYRVVARPTRKRAQWSAESAPQTPGTSAEVRAEVRVTKRDAEIESVD